MVTVILLCSFLSSIWQPSLECAVGLMAASFKVEISSSSAVFSFSKSPGVTSTWHVPQTQFPPQTP